jgi:hypothetical protein
MPASSMASATPGASVRGHSTLAPEDRGVRGLRRHAEWPHEADAVSRQAKPRRLSENKHKWHVGLATACRSCLRWSRPRHAA